jgi:hypothetical protein
MKITEYLNTNDEPMVLILDEENDKAESMTKAQYDERQVQAEHFTPKVAGK